MTHVAVLGNNASDEELNEAPGIVATLVTDAQVATPGFLDDFDAFMFTRPGGAFNATLSAGAAAQVRAFTRRAVLLNGDFADSRRKRPGDPRPLRLQRPLGRRERRRLHRRARRRHRRPQRQRRRPARAQLHRRHRRRLPVHRQLLHPQHHGRRHRPPRARQRHAAPHIRRHRVRRPRHRARRAGRCSPATPATTTPRSSQQR